MSAEGAGGGVHAELVGRWLPPPPVLPSASPPPQPRLPVGGSGGGGSSVDSQLSPSPRKLFRPGTGHCEPGAEGPCGPDPDEEAWAPSAGLAAGQLHPGPVAMSSLPS